MSWFSRLFRRPDLGLQIEAHKFGAKPKNAETYSFDLAIAAKRRAESREKARRKQAARSINGSKRHAAEVWVKPQIVRRKEGA